MILNWRGGSSHWESEYSNCLIAIRNDAAEPEKEGQMSERQAEALLQSMKDEEARVQLDERKATRRVYNDW